MKRRRVLALDAWLGGSHEQFLESWREHSQHELEIRGLRPRAFRWRMRSSAWQFGKDLSQANTERPDALFVTGFTDVSGLRGMLPGGWRELPIVLYMHENQLSYPRREGTEAQAERDHHLGFTQILSCLAADAVVFNSEFHRADFERAATAFLERLPKPNPRVQLLEKLGTATVISPGLNLDQIPLGAGAPPGGPMRVLYNQRWEWDKAPEVALAAIDLAVQGGADLELCLLGERAPSEVRSAAKVIHRGYAESRDEYARLLGSCDVVISTALHEFFGIAVGEAIAAGCTPLLPRRLAYPELARGVAGAVLYEGEDDAHALADLLQATSGGERESHRDPNSRRARREAMKSYAAVETARALDRTFETLLRPL